MKPEVVKSKKEELELNFEVGNKGVLNLVKDKLLQDKSVKMAGFRVTHPEIGKIIFVVKTSGKDAKKAWNDAISALDKKVDEASKVLAKI